MNMTALKRAAAGLLFVFAAAGAVRAQGLTVSGILDSIVTLGAGAGDTSRFYYGLEEYANLRAQAKVRDRAVFYGALNLIAAAGNPAKNALDWGLYQGRNGLGASYVSGENYLAAIELERLYFRINGESLDFDGGLMRIAFGYGQVFGPSDFLNPKNPLVPDARPRAVLGGTLSAYPLDSLKLQLFAAAPKDPLAVEGGGGLAGFSGDYHWDRASLQVLYAFESPKAGSRRGIHRYGMSLKADMELGFMADLLYTYNPEDRAGVEGLAFSGGCDYSFLDGKWYVQAEYLYNGAASSTAAGSGNLAGFSGEHLLYTGATWLYSDYTSFTLACLSGFSDISFVPILSVEHELFQGFTLSLNCQIPLDRSLSGGEAGEFGPLPPGRTEGRRFQALIKTRLRF